MNTRDEVTEMIVRLRSARQHLKYVAAKSHTDDAMCACMAVEYRTMVEVLHNGIRALRSLRRDIVVCAVCGKDVYTTRCNSTGPGWICDECDTSEGPGEAGMTTDFSPREEAAAKYQAADEAAKEEIVSAVKETLRNAEEAITTYRTAMQNAGYADEEPPVWLADARDGLARCARGEWE